jgi:DNA-binding NtrC family response regulator/pSer/pThr/pTyr-binding forkhead associated (FHA) protein
MESRLTLVVTRGPDEGARLEADEHLRIIGRARDADLVLTDLSVSRRHLDVQVVSGRLRVRALPESAPFVRDRATMRETELVAGAAITVGTTVLSAVLRPVTEVAALPRVERTDARTLLHGAAIDVKGLAAITALMTSLDGARDRRSVEGELTQWSRLHADAVDAALHLEDAPEDGATCEQHRRSPDDLVVRETPGSDDGTSVTVPAHSDRRAWVTYRFNRPPSAIGDAQRRLLLVAGRVCGSSLARIRAVSAVEAQLEEVRKMALGSARAFLGTSPAAVKVASMIPRIAASSVPVLIQGETGVGKTFVARLIHEAGERASEPMRVINCASIPESLLESELFGHERGAFTGATATRPGALEAAGAGTLFLDEVGELSLGSQAKLLRAIEERKFERLGSNRTLELRARVICATNRDLAAMSKDGRFRSDLFFRISVVSLHIPPLRERGEDLVLLARQILSDLKPTTARRVDDFTDAAIDAIRQYPWPGNVRELRNAVEHALVLGAEPLIEPTDFPEPLGVLSTAPAAPPPAAAQEGGDAYVRLPARLDALEAKAIEVALKATGGNRSKAAALLGINRATLFRKLEPAGK